MNYIVSGEKISIDTDKKPFAQGSEGRLYLKNGNLYKIYDDAALNEGFGDKRFYHIGMIGIETKQVDMPKSAILETNSKYVGYTTTCITRKRKDNFGTTQLPTDVFLKNIQTLLEDVKILSNLHILMNDVSYFNYLLHDETMHIVDPGRYRFTDSDNMRANIMQLKELLIILIYLDLCHYKVDQKRKIQIFRQQIGMEIKSAEDLYEYFNNLCSNYKNFEEYAKERIRYIK